MSIAMSRRLLAFRRRFAGPIIALLIPVAVIALMIGLVGVQP